MKNALYVNGKGPQYELNSEEFCIPVFPDNNHKLFVRVSTLDFQAYKKLLNCLNVPRTKNVGSDVSDFVAIMGDGFNEVLDDHFLELSGVKDSTGTPLSPERQKEFLAARRAVKDRITLGLVGNIASPEDATDPISPSDDGYIIFDEVGDTQQVDTEVTLGEFSNRTEQVINVTHVLRMPSEADRISYQKASKLHSKTENKKEYQWSTTNFDSLNKLFDKLIIKVEGVVLDGEPCDESNRDQWLPKVPLPWKSFVLSDVFGKVERKNV